MQRTNRVFIKRGYSMLALAMIIASLQLAGCARKTSTYDTTAQEEPARIEPIEGTELSNVILTDDAAKRLDIQTEEVREMDYEGEPHTAIPYSAVLVDKEGTSWTYTSPEPLTFVRHKLDVDTVDGDLAILTDGPPIGTRVVTVARRNCSAPSSSSPRSENQGVPEP
jgi:hypothetical protein